jgi:Tfp pilus assembly protein PilO
MARDFKFERSAIVAGVALLLVADVALGVYSWRLSRGPKTTAQSMDVEAHNLRRLKADIEEAEKVEANFPKTVKDCDKFEQSLPLAANASSTIEAELGEASKKSGAQLTGVVLHDKDVASRNITERLMDATVSGNYENVVRFLNGLQKSPNFYVVDSLELTSDATTPNVLRVTMHMRTFFRTAAA